VREPDHPEVSVANVTESHFRAIQIFLERSIDEREKIFG